MAKKKNKNIIDVQQSYFTFTEKYDLDARIFNFYQFRISAYEDDGFFDWFHTTGTLTHNKNGYCKAIPDKKFLTADEVAVFIIKFDN